jgi:prepilin-type N-terminal cleavage/methylation domain-containing protein
MATTRRGAGVSAAGDSGMTALEMIVALLIVGIVATAFVSVIVQSISTGRVHELRVAANQLAQDRLESVVAQPWSAIGLYSSDPGFTTSAGGENTVILTTSPRPASVPLPSDSVTKLGVSFSIRTDITWRDDPTDLLGANDLNGNTNDVKHVVVAVSWNYKGNPRSVTLDDIRSPTASEAPPTSGSSFTVSVSAPATQTLSPTGTIPSPGMTVTATTSKVASGVTLSFTTRSGPQTVAMTNASGGTSWTATLNGTGPFDTGPTTFSVAATATTTNANGSTVVLLQGAGTGSATVTAAASPTQQLTTSGTLSTAITVNVTGSANISSGTVSYAVHGSTASKALTGSGTSWSSTIAADSTTYDAGSETFTVTVTFADATSRTAYTTISLFSAAVPPSISSLVVNDPFGGGAGFCTDNGYSLFTATAIDATVANVGTTDTVQLSAPGLSATLFTMLYLKTNADGTMVFRFTAPSGTQFPAATSIVLKVAALKTISGTQYRDDLVTSPAIPIQTFKKSSSCV